MTLVSTARLVAHNYIKAVLMKHAFLGLVRLKLSLNKSYQLFKTISLRKLKGLVFCYGVAKSELLIFAVRSADLSCIAGLLLEYHLSKLNRENWDRVRVYIGN